VAPPTRRIARSLGTLVALGLLAWAVAGCKADGAAAPEFDRKPPVVEVVRIVPEELVDVAVFSGQLDAEQSVMVKPEIEGIIASIEFREGQEVSEGDLLFRLRSREQAALLREAKANRDLAGERWERAKELLSRDAASIAAADVARAEYEIAAARVELAEVALERTNIRAPFDGIVGLRLVDLGARVEEETELVRIDAVDRLQVSFGISDEGLPFATTGMRVAAHVRPYPREKFAGEVFFVSPSLDPRNRRILVKAWIDNSDRRLAPGLFANVDLEIRRIEAAIVVPESAIAVDRQGPHVWRIDDEDKAIRQPIEIGLRERGVVEVVQGLQAGVRVVVAGSHKLSEGKQVQIAETAGLERARRSVPEGSILGEGT
jgi:membrane fusion protein (multidrug efflux system)